MQWLLLRKHVQKAGWWILATLGGWAVTLLVAARVSVLLEVTPDELISSENYAVIALGIFVAGLLLGIVTALLQWFVIRNVHEKSFLWIMFSSVGWIVGLFTGSVVGLSVYQVLQQYSSLFGSRLDINPNTLIRWPVILAGIATGVTAGAITGTAYAWWIQNTKTDEIPQNTEFVPDTD
jgi:MFS family permease